MSPLDCFGACPVLEQLSCRGTADCRNTISQTVAAFAPLLSTAGYIDLSKKHVDEDENKEYTAFYASSSLVHGIVRKVAHDAGVPMLLIYRKVVWPLYRQAPRSDDDDDFSFDPLHGFHRVNENPDVLDDLEPALDEDASASGAAGADAADPAGASSGAGAGEEEDLSEVDWETDPRPFKALSKELQDSIKTKLVAEIRHRLRD